MIGILVLLFPFFTASIGIIQSNMSTAAHSIFGLTKIGAVLVGLSFLGLIIGVLHQLRSSHVQSMQVEKMDSIYNALGLAADQLAASDPGTAAALREVQGRLDHSHQQIQGSIFASAIVSAADFSSARVEKSLFRSANLEMSDFSSARLNNSIFSSARLDESDFSSARLDGSQFLKARFDRALFTEANFVEADFRNADLSMILWDSTTIMPVGVCAR
jgi:uncharacterized protein YjbI with pentapeptide repeats